VSAGFSSTAFSSSLIFFSFFTSLTHSSLTHSRLLTQLWQDLTSFRALRSVTGLAFDYRISIHI
jgi:hypothetical protein